MDKFKELKKIVDLCEVRFNRGKVSDWKHGDFSHLSRDIRRVSKVNISPNTLKRVFGKIPTDDGYTPQQATIEALKEYSLYDFKIDKQPVTIPKTSNTVFRYLKEKRLVFFLLLGFVSIIILTLFFINNPNNKEVGNFEIKVSNIEGKLPATVFFNLDFPLTKDSLFVNFGDKSPIKYLDTIMNGVTHNYLYPGVFKAQIQTKNKIIVSTNVTVPSDGWIALAFNELSSLPNRYYEYKAFKHENDSVFHVDDSELYKMGIDTIGRNYTRLSNYKNTGKSGDEFEFESVFKNKTNENGIYCDGVQFEVAGESNRIKFKFVSEGCSYRVINILSEKIFDGRKTNLSNFAINLKEWNSIKIINRNKEVSLYLNDELFYSDTYSKSLGELKGVYVEFEGNGFIKKCALKTLQGESLFDF